MSNDKKALGKIALQKQASAPGADPAAALEALRALSERYGVPGLDLTQVAIPLEHLDLLPREIAARHGVLPVLVQDERIFLAMANPEDKRVIDELEFVTGKRVFPYVAAAQPLAKVIEQAYEMRLRGETFYLGPSVPQEVLVKLGLATPSSSRGPQSPAARPEPTGLKSSVLPSKVDVSLDGSPATSFTEGDFVGGSELSAVAAMPVAVTEPTKPSGDATATAKTILVVDDEDDIRRLLKRVLTDRGYRVIEADRGNVALRLVKEHAPDLIVLDAMLPEMHGFEICRRIKGSEKYGQIPIVMISAVYRGWRFAEDLKQNYGVDAYIEKPFRISEVTKAIEHVLNARGGEPQPDREKISADAEKALQTGITAYQNGDIDTAIQHLKRGSTIDPLAYRLHYHLGLLYGKKGQVYEAIQALETAVEINGKHFPALKNLAVLYQKAGFKLKAVELWERALANAPDEPTKSGIREHLLTLL
jgi:DNA-binding response OmpR family regulator